ncbi:hypothetical protein QPM17_17600 [Marinobacter sp. TBZ242]|jgi:hypothetical protein|uniref:Integrase n=1 Tax=Marinobacter azerbaijanicus TaxID=3050455 RepID=A0ABT7IIJ7_9GAMM|nr:hypothetical protein [Marinobacter sp. TBZ242]MBL83348.1 hypothetical protein [Marinobacter sp.]MDL0432963.1 hypothetical protein [Marinobacter sp. TBZ242]|tara:strand:- start:2164 stop:2517 length:354 start_codon:yes stop_codon:yes gene_type:complete
MNLTSIIKRIKAGEGGDRARRRHISRIEKMVAAVEVRFPEVKRHQQIQQKHVRWLLEHWCNPSTKKDYRSSLRLLLEAQDRDPNWLRQLGMPPASSGGRPRDVTIIRSRSAKTWLEY